MRTQTAERVVDLLGLVEQLLADGRPRKRPGKPRPEAVTMAGKTLRRVTSQTSLLHVQKTSLAGAIKYALHAQGYSRYILRVAVMELSYAAYFRAKTSSTNFLTVSELDEFCDTRELIRIVRSARRYIERSYLT